MKIRNYLLYCENILMQVGKNVLEKSCLQVTILPKLPRPPPEALAILFHQSSPWSSDHIEILSSLVILPT